MPPTDALLKLTYSIEEFALMTTLSKAQVYIEISTGRLQVRKAGRRSLVTAKEAQRWLDALPIRQENSTSAKAS